MAGGSTIFIAYSDDAVRESVRFLLETCGHTVRDFPSPAAVLDAVAAATPDCLVLDHHLPGMTGVELAEAVWRRGLVLPIVLTTDVAAELRIRVWRAGAVTMDVATGASLIDAVTAATSIWR